MKQEQKMHDKKESYLTLIWIISIIISVGIGTFVLRVLETTPLNLWITRIVGCAVAVISELIFYYFRIKRMNE